MLFRSLLVLLILSGQASQASWLSKCERLLKTIQFNMPIVSQLKFGIPRGALGIFKPLDEVDLGLLAESEQLKQELGIWRAYNQNGELLAVSNIILGNRADIDVGAIRDEFENFWSELKQIHSAADVGKVAFIHTHPTQDLLGVIYMYDRFSDQDNSVARFLQHTCLPLKKDRAHLRLEMHILFNENDKPRQVGYRLHR